ncbi:DHH family phosphoesterase [Natronosalvus amylolyticus]|uniref:DHH family phosphoesterase n=1 Tax=Natronosalvus amylolyticus TaxID=2961994 RepID=UPI0020C9FBB6|nr:bifunctional oligoribonuclease/PAP phosphatase NrnA [Natronosalvus amylolyticus]
MSRAAALVSVLEACDSLAIVCHDNPDPDTLASALALQEIATSSEADLSNIAITYGGSISHQQNRAFVNLLDIDVEPIGAVPLDSFDCIAFVDHSKQGVNTSLTTELEPSIVVDHHPGPPIEAAFADVRTDYGATATIFVEYLQELELSIPPRLATALLFALHRERLDYLREPTLREYEAALAVYRDADLETLERLYGSAFSPGTIDAIGRAIVDRKQRGSSMIASVGRTTETDALPQAAEYLLNVEGVDTVLAYGIIDGTIRLSARSLDPRVNVGQLLGAAFGDLGSVGGHHDMAGGWIELGLFGDDGGDDDEALLSLVDTRIRRRFFEALNLEEASST